MIYLISYDQRKAGRQYKELYKVLETLSAIRVQSSVWAIKTEKPKKEIYDAILATLDNHTDRLLVVPFDAAVGYHNFNGANKLNNL